MCLWGTLGDSSYSWPDLRDLGLSRVMAPVRSEVEFGTDIPGPWNVQLEADSLIQPGHSIQKETEPWGHVGLGQCHTGQGRPLFCSLYLHSLIFFSHSFVHTFHSSGTSLSTYSMADRPWGFRAESVAAPMLKSSDYSPGSQACVTICQVPSAKRGHDDPGEYPAPSRHAGGASARL